MINKITVLWREVNIHWCFLLFLRLKYSSAWHCCWIFLKIVYKIWFILVSRAFWLPTYLFYNQEKCLTYLMKYLGKYWNLIAIITYRRVLQIFQRKCIFGKRYTIAFQLFCTKIILPLHSIFHIISDLPSKRSVGVMPLNSKNYHFFKELTPSPEKYEHYFFFQ